MRKSIGRRVVLAAAGSTLAFPAIRAHAQASGVALVIGNSKYHWEAPLPNVRRDAPDLAKRFQAMGLRTELVQDAGLAAMRQAIDKFIAGARGANFAAFYFAGHGATWAKETYLVPVDADLSSPNTVQTLLPVASISAGLEAANNRLLVFDNCRNNPADGWRQQEAEHAAFIGDLIQSRPRAPNTLILYSTAPGRIALDGPAGENSPFAATLLRQLEVPSVDLQALPARLRRDLLIATQARQVLFDQSSYQTPFVLPGARGTAASGTRGGWANDPSRIVELPNTYAFSQQHNMQLPPGLIAHRPPGNSPHAAKIGAFRFEFKTPNAGFVPGLLVVMSVEEQDSAEVVFLTTVSGRGGWRFFRPKLSSDTIEFAGGFGGQFVFKWNDANSGTVTMFPRGRGPQGGLPTTTRFARLDG